MIMTRYQNLTLVQDTRHTQGTYHHHARQGFHHCAAGVKKHHCHCGWLNIQNKWLFNPILSYVSLLAQSQWWWWWWQWLWWWLRRHGKPLVMIISELSSIFPPTVLEMTLRCKNLKLTNVKHFISFTSSVSVLILLVISISLWRKCCNGNEIAELEM